MLYREQEQEEHQTPWILYTECGVAGLLINRVYVLLQRSSGSNNHLQDLQHLCLLPQWHRVRLAPPVM